VTGSVLEVGIGTGLNLLYYPPAVRRIHAVDVNQGMQRRALRRMKQSGMAVDYRILDGEELPFPSENFDSVVTTFTLCSIGPIEKALLEMRRVLKPGGKFFFLEHGKSDEATVARWQNRLNSLENKIAVGCHLNRGIQDLISQAGFKMERCDRFYLKATPKPWGAFYQGIATPIAA
ncbi:MAG: class I SAM-dependent methyltransferase, partial [Deltaproteobacteria bacterium]|nr:class I SAM-dependent methyltransferase [Deltaproteobacteria bacterium]